jgi:membrane fusion protein (multidrug efflux system)
LDERILPDMGVKVAFQETGADNQPQAASAGILVPGKAVREADGQTYVLIYTNGTVERRAVRVESEIGGDVLVRSGLRAGERVVIGGPDNLADGDSVKEKT